MVKARKDLRAGIGDVLADKALRVSEVTEVVPYKHNEVTKIAKEAREAGARPEDRDAPET